jgi:hypothetical protein
VTPEIFSISIARDAGHVDHWLTADLLIFKSLATVAFPPARCMANASAAVANLRCLLFTFASVFG